MLIFSTFTLPCDDPTNPQAESEECKKCLHPCKESTDGCCSETLVSGYTQEGIFKTYNKPAIAGGHAMLLIGWNDNFRVNTGLPGYRGRNSMGGFILRNSWNTTVGHSAEYWAQSISTIEENTICPCEASALTWMPVDAE